MSDLVDYKKSYEVLKQYVAEYFESLDLYLKAKSDQRLIILNTRKKRLKQFINPPISKSKQATIDWLAQ